MARKIFINYRREDSIGTAGRLYDRLVQAFETNNLFMDVDQIPAGVDFVSYLSAQVAVCDVFLTIIGPNWLDLRDESGGRRIDSPDDFVAIEIATALERNILVIPILIDGARMPKVNELPDALKPLARRQALELRHTQFGRDANALIAKVIASFGKSSFQLRVWQKAALVAMPMAAALLVGWIALYSMGGTSFWITETKNSATAPTDTKVVQPAALQAERERKAKADAEAEAKRKAEETERQRQATLQAERERKAKADAEVEAIFNEAIRLNPNYAQAYGSRGAAYRAKGENDRAIADFNEAIRLNPNYAQAYGSRGAAYRAKGENDRAIADFNEAIPG